MLDLVRAHWGLGSDVLADVFLPDGSAEGRHIRWVAARLAPSEVACQLLAQCYETRVDDLLDRIARRRWSCTGAAIAPSRTAWDGTSPSGSRARGWCRSPAGATFPTPATPHPWSGRSWSSSAPPAEPGSRAAGPRVARPLTARQSRSRR